MLAMEFNHSARRESDDSSTSHWTIVCVFLSDRLRTWDVQLRRAR